MPEESREVRKSRRIRRFRRLLLLATVVAVVAVVAVYLVGRRERAAPAPASLGPAKVAPRGDMVTVGQGFERTFTEGNRPIFRIRGDSFGVDRKRVVYLTGVGLTVFQEDGSHYQVESQKARFDTDKKEARLQGKVTLSAPDGLVLKTARLLLTNRGHQVASPGAVNFTLGHAYRGHADRLHGWLESRRFVLSGAVRVASLPGAETPFNLKAPQLIVDRTRKLLQARGWAVLRHGGDQVSAGTMLLFFADDEKTMRFLRARGRVRGALRQGGETAGAPAGADGTRGATAASVVAFRTQDLGLLFTDDGRQPRQVDLDKGPGGRALLRTLNGPKRPLYRFTAPVITGYFEQGAPVKAAAHKGVVFTVEAPRADAEKEEVAAIEEAPPESVEPPPAGAPEEAAADEETPEEVAELEEEPEEAAHEAAERQATGDTATAAFDASGGVSTVEIAGDVVLTDGKLEGRGARALFGADAQQAELEGKPAVVESDRGRMEAPRILYTRSGGLLHGTGGVRTRLEEADDTALGGTPLTRGEGPVWVEADEGFLGDQPRSFLFHGRVRAWRGENLLVADDLRGDDAEHRLQASGAVRTLWTPESHAAGDPGAARTGTTPRAASGPGAGASSAAAGASAGQGPLETTSDELTYRRDDRLLVYTGDVTAKQEERTLTCHEMEIHLAEAGGVERLICTGDVHVDDPGQGRSLTGEHAVYDPTARTIEVEAAAGGKVTMHDQDGNVIEGPKMIYEIDENRVHVLGRPTEDGTEPAPPPAPAAPSPPTPAEPPPR